MHRGWYENASTEKASTIQQG